jgi:hypothetical protein
MITTMKYTDKFLFLTTVGDLDVGFAAFVENFKGEVFNVGLHFGIREFASNKSFSIENTDKIRKAIDKRKLTESDRKHTCCTGS